MPEAVLAEPKHVLEGRSEGHGVREDTRSVLRAVAPGVLAAVRSVLGPAHPDCEDVVQDSLIAIVRALPSFRGESSVLHFAKQIAIRKSIDAMRRTIRDRRKREAVGQEVEAAQRPSLLERHKQQWRELLVELPDAQAEALVLRAIQGYSIEEIADLTAVPAETVRSRLRLAKSTLRSRITDDPSLADLALEGA